MQQSIIVSLFALSCMITSYSPAMDICTIPSTSTTMNAIEQATHDLAAFIRNKQHSPYNPEDITRTRSLINNGAALNNNDFYILHDAVRYNQEVLVADLLKAGAHINRSEDGKTPLLIACKRHVAPSIMHLLLKKGPHVNHQDNNNNTALHRLVLSLTKQASRQKVMDKICHLLHAGIFLSAPNNHGLTPEELLENLGLLEECAGKIDTINTLLKEGTHAPFYKQWLEELESYENGEQIDKEKRFETHLALSEEFKAGLYQPTARNIGRSDSCPEYPRFSMFTLATTPEPTA